MPSIWPCIYRMLPTRWMTRFFGKFARCETPWFKNFAIRLYCRLYPINLAEAEYSDITQYPCLDAFFIRRLKAGARDLNPANNLLVSPVDGKLMQHGHSTQGQCLQVKGIPYQIEHLVADKFLAQHYQDGIFINLYLAPADYHRIHMPLSGQLQHMSYIPGPLLPVKPGVINHTRNVLAGNERVVCEFSTAFGSMLVVMVGALCVGGIEVSWESNILNPEHSAEVKHWNYSSDTKELAAGDELGCFHMGSAVVIILNHPHSSGLEGLTCGQTLQVGQQLCTLHSATST